MEDVQKYADQCKQFCYYRYEFFKRSDAYTLAQKVTDSVLHEKIQAGADAVFFDEIFEAASKLSPEALKAVELNHKYSVLGNNVGWFVGTSKEGKHISKETAEISVFDIPYLMRSKINISVSIEEILTLDSSIDVIKERITKHFRESFPAEIGIPLSECENPMATSEWESFFHLKGGRNLLIHMTRRQKNGKAQLKSAGKLKNPGPATIRISRMHTTK